MQNFFVKVKHDKGFDYLKTTAIDRESLLATLPRTLNCPESAICAVVRVFDHEFENLPASTIATSAGLFKLVIDKCDLKWGAPTGRGNVYENNLIDQTKPDDEIKPGKTFDRRIDLDNDGYDKGGAYWGRGTELRVTYNQDLTYIQFYRR